MSFRPPSAFALFRQLTTGADSLEAEILSEKAAALGRSGDAVERALAALRQAEGDARVTLAYAAAEAVQGLFIQRELMGLRGQTEVIRQYDIPREVLSRIGAKPPSAG